MTTATATATPTPTIRRRNSLDSPSTLSPNTPSSSSSNSSLSSSWSVDYELISLKPASYTSLRDLLPSTPTFNQSPKPTSFTVQPVYEISIRNRLVKQAAWAYLQPMSTSLSPGGHTVFHRLWNRLSDVFVCLVTQFCGCFNLARVAW